MGSVLTRYSVTWACVNSGRNQDASWYGDFFAALVCVCKIALAGSESPSLGMAACVDDRSGVHRRNVCRFLLAYHPSHLGHKCLPKRTKRTKRGGAADAYACFLRFGGGGSVLVVWW